MGRGRAHAQDRFGLTRLAGGSGAQRVEAVQAALRSIADRVDPASALAALYRVLADRVGLVPPGGLRLLGGPAGAPDDDLAATLPDGLTARAAADLLGQGREWLLTAPERRRGGAVYTSAVIAQGVLDQALIGWTGGTDHTGHSDDPGGPGFAVCDPAVGGGVFLLAAADRLLALGAPADRIVDGLLFGSDVDPLAIATTEAALSLWSWAADGQGRVPPPGHLVVGDPLLAGRALWPGTGQAAAGFDLVVGNPPYQSQLAGSTARSADRAEELKARWGDVIAGYADTAAIFLVAGCDLVRPGGRMSLIVPESVLGSRDTRAARTRLLDRADLVALWVATEPVFTAAVKVCAPVLQLKAHPEPAGEPTACGAPTSIQRTQGPGFAALAPARGARAALADHASWSHLVLAAYGTPEVDLAAGTGTLGDLASATAGFRDQFYGLVPYVAEAPDTAGASPSGTSTPLVTVGLIDVGGLAWGRRSTRFAGERWERPIVDLVALAAGAPGLARWVEARLVPKVLVATQTKVIEAMVDKTGRLVPSVPVVSLEPRTDDPALLWRFLAVLSAPPVSAWALQQAAGLALAADTIKLSARQVLAIPLPSNVGHWHAAADLLAAGSAPTEPAVSARMTEAYGLPAQHPVHDWWHARLPR